MITQKTLFKCGLTILLFLVLMMPTYAWWNESFNERHALTLINNYSDAMVNYPVTVNLSTIGASCSNIRVIYNETVSLSWINLTACGLSNTIIRFRVNISALSNSTSYAIYFNASGTFALTTTNATDIIGAQGFRFRRPRWGWDFDNTSIGDLSYGTPGEAGTFNQVNGAAVKIANLSCFADRCIDLPSTASSLNTNNQPAIYGTESANFTFSLWLNPHYGASNITGLIFNNDRAVQGSTQFINTIASTKFYTYPGSGDYHGLDISRGLNGSFDNRWIHVLVRRIVNAATNTKNYSYYVNGEYWSSSSYTGNIGGTGTGADYFFLGTQGWNNTFIGYYDELMIDDYGYSEEQIRHLALYYNIGYATNYTEFVGVAPSMPFISPVPIYIEQNTSINVNWTASNFSNEYVNYNLSLLNGSPAWSIVTANLTFNYNASEPLGLYEFGIFAIDAEDLVSNVSYSNWFHICAVNFSCSSYDDCNMFNVTECLAVTDSGCGHEFAGNLSDYDEYCIYGLPEPSNIDIADFDIDSVQNVLIILVVAVLWLGVIAMAFIFHNMGFAAFGFFIGIGLGLLFAQVSVWLTLVFMMLNIFMFIRYGTKMS